MTDPVATHIDDGHFIEPEEPLLVLNRDGETFSVEVVIAVSRDHRGRTTGYILTLRDLTERRKLTHQISYQASHDALTGLYNRFEFGRRLQCLLKPGGRGGQHALLYLDLDQFKVVNDTCGHAAGDDLLSQLGLALRARARSRDTLARLGGDE